MLEWWQTLLFVLLTGILAIATSIATSILNSRTARRTERREVMRAEVEKELAAVRLFIAEASSLNAKRSTSIASAAQVAGAGLDPEGLGLVAKYESSIMTAEPEELKDVLIQISKLVFTPDPAPGTKFAEMIHRATRLMRQRVVEADDEAV